MSCSLPRSSLVDDRVVLDEVDDADKVGLGPIGSWIGTGWAPSRSIIVLHGVAEVGADAVHLVDEGDARDVILVGLPPNGLGLRLHAGDRVEQGYGAVEHTQRTLDLDGEVNVAWRIDDVIRVSFHSQVVAADGDRDATLLLLLHPVHDGSALMNLADLVRTPRVRNRMRSSRRRLTGVDVRHDPDVAGSSQG